MSDSSIPSQALVGGYAPASAFGHTGTVSGPAGRAGRHRTRDDDGGRDEEPVLPDRPLDERDVGWGDDPESGRRDDDWYRRERPPHHE
jgi:hypothetical protein